MNTTDLIYDAVKNVQSELKEVKTELMEMKSMQSDLALVKANVDELTAYKNKLIGASLCIGGIFAFGFEIVKDFFTKG